MTQTYLHALTDENRANLDRLATKLEALPKSYKHFEMDSFIRAADEDGYNDDTFDFDYAEGDVFDRLIEYVTKNGGVDAIGEDLKCGTVACAVGHGPSAGLFLTQEEINKEGDGLNWAQYARRLFTGEEPDRLIDRDGARYRSFFEWMFGGDWSAYDNHHWGAAARIRYVLHHGYPPEDFIAGYGYCYDQQEYESFRVTRKRSLPKGYYTPEMLAVLEPVKLPA